MKNTMGKQDCKYNDVIIVIIRKFWNVHRYKKNANEYTYCVSRFLNFLVIKI